MFYVKVKRATYESVLGIYKNEAEATEHASQLNSQYQTDEYYVEPFDAAKVWHGNF